MDRFDDPATLNLDRRLCHNFARTGGAALQLLWGNSYSHYRMAVSEIVRYRWNVSIIPIDSQRLARKVEASELLVWKAGIQHKLTRLEVLSKEIKPWYDDIPADTITTEQVGDYELQIGARSVEKRWSSMAAVRKSVGNFKAFQDLCTVTYKALSNAIGNEQASALQIETQTGSRRLTAFRNTAVEVAVEALPKAA